MLPEIAADDRHWQTYARYNDQHWWRFRFSGDEFRAAVGIRKILYIQKLLRVKYMEALDVQNSNDQSSLFTRASISFFLQKKFSNIHRM